jgi:hypothetical protein
VWDLKTGAIKPERHTRPTLVGHRRHQPGYRLDHRRVTPSICGPVNSDTAVEHWHRLDEGGDVVARHGNGPSRHENGTCRPSAPSAARPFAAADMCISAVLMRSVAAAESEVRYDT